MFDPVGFELLSLLCTFEILRSAAKYRSILIPFRIAKRSFMEVNTNFDQKHFHIQVDLLRCNEFLQR